MGERGTVTIGIDYYTDLVREHAIMQKQISQLKRFLRNEEERISRMVYIKDVAEIFDLAVSTGEDE